MDGGNSRCISVARMADSFNDKEASVSAASVSGRFANWPMLRRTEALKKAGWVTFPYIVSQAIRLLSNILLAWLLAPELLGTMLLINTLRTGGELLTDVGVGQSIVNNPRGNQPDFYNTAWTIQIIRGLALSLLALVLTIPVARAYENPQLLVLLPAAAPIFLISGLASPARFLLQKSMEVRKIGIFDLSMMVLGTSIQVLLAWLMPTIWALILGLLIGATISSIGSYLLMDWRSLRLRWDKESVGAVIHFGKWIFASSLVYFLAMNFDRLYLADAIPLAILGIYGIARTFADTVLQLFQRIGNFLIFPRISSTSSRGHDLRRQVLPLRLGLTFVIAVGLAFAVALADEFIVLLYDERYRMAGIILTLLLIGTWFGILATIADAMMMGVSKPSIVAFGNAAKLAVIVIALPLLLSAYGFAAALALLVGAEAARYAVLVLRTRKIGLGFTRQDIAMTLLFLLLVFGFRELTMIVGLTEGLSGWFEQVENLDA